MTEVERYEKRGDNASSSGQKKGGKKSPQEAWMDLVVSAVDEAPAHLKSQLGILAGLDNVPRKEKQFRNFASNSLNMRGNKNNNNRGGANVVSEIWTFLKSRQQQAQDERKKVEEQQALEKQQSKNNTETENSKCQPGNESNVATAQATISENESSTESSVAAVKIEGAESKEAAAAPETTITVKTVRKAMKTVLKKSNSISTKRLRKAVQRHMGALKSNKKAIKSMITQNLKSGSSDDKKSQTFILEGETISLALSK
jgi:hypothetical protein